MARLDVKTWRSRDGTALRLYAQRADGSTVGWFEPRSDRHELHDRSLYKAFWAAVLAERDRLRETGDLDQALPRTQPAGQSTARSASQRPQAPRTPQPQTEPARDVSRTSETPASPVPSPQPSSASAPAPGRSMAKAGASAQAEYRTRKAMRRRERLTVAAIVGTAAGLTVGIWLGSWTAGIIAAAVALVVLWAVRRARHDSVAAWKKGAKGERRTAKQLRHLERSGWHIRHDLAIPGSNANIDHLAIGPAGVFVIDSKHWGSATSRVRVRRGHLYYGARSQDKALRTCAWEAHRAAQELTQASGYPVEVHPLLVLQGGRLLFWTRQLHGVRILGGQLLVPYLRRQQHHHTPTDIHALARAADHALPAYTHT